jgi:hypothetical protein
MGDQKFVNKVMLEGQSEPLIDISTDTVEAQYVLDGKTFHNASGAPDKGTCTFNVDAREANALASEVLSGQKFVGANQQIAEGTMPRITEDVVINDLNTKTLSTGFYNGRTVSILKSEADKIIPENIRENVEILGVKGTMTGQEGIETKDLTVKPSFTEQTISPPPAEVEGNIVYYKEVKVEAIPVVYTANGGGLQVKIG